MRVQVSLMTIFAGILLFSCESPAPASEQVQKKMLSNTEDQRRLKALIDSMENVVYKEEFDFDKSSTSDLMDGYSEYILKFPADKKLTPEYLYKSAAISRGIGHPVNAIKFYDRILKDYPKYERNPEVAFLLAFTYDEDLREPERAKEAYEELLEMYPDDMWAEQAAARLENIDKSDAELIQSFMEKSKVK